MADRAENNKVPARNAPNSDQEPQRSRAPGDRPAPPHRDEMNRKTAPGRASAAPSSPAPVANRITATESPTKKACNRLLQQNLPKADIAAICRTGVTGYRRSFRLDVGCADHLAPFLGVVGDELGEVSGRAHKRRAAEVGEPRFHIGVCKGRVDLVVELVDDLNRRVLGRADAEPEARL